MGYNRVIDSALNSAMLALKDLADSGTISRKRASGYNFGTKQVDLVEDQIGKIRIVIEEKRQQGGTIKFSAIIMVVDVPFPVSDYDVITVNGSNWRFGGVAVNSGRVIIAELFKVT